MHTGNVTKRAPTSQMATLLYIILYIIIPFLLFTALIIAGTIVLSYTIYLARPIPVHFVIAITVTIAGLILTGMTIYLTNVFWGKDSKATENKDVEDRLTGSHRPMAQRKVDDALRQQSLKEMSIHRPPSIHFSTRHPQAYGAKEWVSRSIAGEAGHPVEPVKWGENQYSAYRNQGIEHPIDLNDQRRSIELPAAVPSAYSGLQKSASHSYWAKQATNLSKGMPHPNKEALNPDNTQSVSVAEQYPLTPRPLSLPESLRSAFRHPPVLDPVPERPRRLRKPPNGSTTPRESAEVRFPERQVSGRTPSYERLEQNVMRAGSKNIG
ncbi:hypothetical protein MMC24_007193 [Lignoscripta atroalba]|nr:hypothetical protein [Lignoscripta atroalba]